MQKAFLGWVCKCDCGKEKWIETRHLTKGYTKSCGCICTDTIQNARKKFQKENMVEGTSLKGISRNLNKNNKTGSKGVCYSPVVKKYVAYLTFKGKKITKRFNTENEAIKYRKELEGKYFKPILEKYKKKRQIVIKCLICGKLVESKSNRKLYCNDCANKVKRQKDILLMQKIQKEQRKYYIKKCNNCGKIFETTKINKKYCSEKCYKENSNMLNALRYQKYGKHVKKSYIKKCPICLEDFETTNARRKYCSTECQRKAHSENMKKMKQRLRNT